MRRISNNTPKGWSRKAIRSWGFMFLVAGAVGQAVVMNVLLGMKDMSGTEIFTTLEGNERNMVLGLVALVTQMAYACAIPIYTFLLVDGFRRTSSIRHYALRLAGVAVLAEIPYNLAMSSVWFDFNSRNPMLAMVLGIAVLYFFNVYSGWKIKNVVIRLLVIALSIVWIEMLRIEHGLAVIVLVCTLWGLRKNRSWQVLGGCAMMFVLGAVPATNPTYWLAPIVFLAAYFYNDEQGEESRIFNYLSYPVMLLVVGLFAKYALQYLL